MITVLNTVPIPSSSDSKLAVLRLRCSTNQGSLRYSVVRLLDCHSQDYTHPFFDVIHTLSVGPDSSTLSWMYARIPTTLYSYVFDWLFTPASMSEKYQLPSLHYLPKPEALCLIPPTLTLVRLSRQLILSTLLYTHFSAARITLTSAAFNVHASDSSVNTGHTNARTTHTSVFSFFSNTSVLPDVRSSPENHYFPFNPFFTINPFRNHYFSIL